MKMVAQKKNLRKPRGGIELQKEFDTLAFTDYNQLVNARGAKAEIVSLQTLIT